MKEFSTPMLSPTRRYNFMPIRMAIIKKTDNQNVDSVECKMVPPF
jgi:hypothetical protein